MDGDGERGRDGGRDRGMLSPADRRYLRGESDLASVQSERNTRARIRQRVYDALLDFEVLVEHLDDHDRTLLFGGQVDEGGTEAFDALVSAVAFVYAGVGDTDLAFETVLREGINLAEARDERAATVALDVTYHALDAETLRAKLERGDDLTLTELAYLHESDAVSRDELAAHLGSDRRADVDDGRVQAKVTDY